MLVGIVGVCVITAVASLFIKKYQPEYSLVLTLLSGALVLTALALTLGEIISELKDIFNSSKLDSEIFKVVIKALGICYITNFAGDTCRDFGQTSLAAKVELAGKITITVLTLPFIKGILSTALELIG